MSTYSGSVRNPTSPNLPIAPIEYSQQFQDQMLNVLRLYFNQVNNSLTYFVQLPSSSTGLKSGSLWYDPADGNRVKYVP